MCLHLKSYFLNGFKITFSKACLTSPLNDPVKCKYQSFIVNILINILMFDETVKKGGKLFKIANFIDFEKYPQLPFVNFLSIHIELVSDICSVQKYEPVKHQFKKYMSHEEKTDIVPN